MRDAVDVDLSGCKNFVRFCEIHYQRAPTPDLPELKEVLNAVLSPTTKSTYTRACIDTLTYVRSYQACSKRRHNALCFLVYSTHTLPSTLVLYISSIS